jgi:ATP-dependent DNA helicase 2 subunit 1
MYSEADDSMPEVWPEVHSSLEVALFGMIQSMRLKEAAKRVAFKIPFHLGEGFVIGISG